MAFYDGKEGRWITTETGRHVFIPQGQTVEQALSDAFDEEESVADESFEPEFDTDNLDLDEEHKKIKDKEHKESFIKRAFRGKLDASYKETKNRLKDHYDKHEVINPEIENTIADHIKDGYAVKKIWAKDEWTGGGTYYSRNKRQIVMNVDYSNHYETMQYFFHEAGHSLDCYPDSGPYMYLSSSYVSKKHGVRLCDMLKEEISQVDLGKVFDKVQELKNEYDNYKKDWKDGKIDEQTMRAGRHGADHAETDIIDVMQASFGYDKCCEIFGYGSHASSYFNDKYEWYGPVNRGTEFFAEMICDLATEKNHYFSKYMEEIAPKSVEIFYEILKEKYGYDKK